MVYLYYTSVIQSLFYFHNSQKVSRARIQYSVAGYTPQVKLSRHFNLNNTQSVKYLLSYHTLDQVTNTGFTLKLADEGPQSHPGHCHLAVVVELEWLNDPKSSVCQLGRQSLGTGSPMLDCSCPGEETQERTAPGPPGWGLGCGPITPSHKKVTDMETHKGLYAPHMA